MFQRVCSLGKEGFVEGKRHAMRPESHVAVTLCTHCWPMVLIMCRVLHIWGSQAVSTDRELSSVIQEEEENVLYLYY